MALGMGFLGSDLDGMGRRCLAQCLYVCCDLPVAIYKYMLYKMLDSFALHYLMRARLFSNVLPCYDEHILDDCAMLFNHISQ